RPYPGCVEHGFHSLLKSLLRRLHCERAWPQPCRPSPKDPGSLSPEGFLERRHLTLGLVSPLRPLVNPVARLLADIFHHFARILIFSAEGAAHLLASLGREQQSHQGAGCQSNQQHGQTQAEASRLFILSVCFKISRFRHVDLSSRKFYRDSGRSGCISISCSMAGAPRWVRQRATSSLPQVALVIWKP